MTDRRVVFVCVRRTGSTGTFAGTCGVQHRTQAAAHRHRRSLVRWYAGRAAWDNWDVRPEWGTR